MVIRKKGMALHTSREQWRVRLQWTTTSCNSDVDAPSITELARIRYSLCVVYFYKILIKKRVRIEPETYHCKRSSEKLYSVDLWSKWNCEEKDTNCWLLYVYFYRSSKKTHIKCHHCASKNSLTLQTFIAFNLNALLFESDSRHGVGFPMIGYALSRTGKVGNFLVKKTNN